MANRTIFDQMEAVLREVVDKEIVDQFSTTLYNRLFRPDPHTWEDSLHDMSLVLLGRFKFPHSPLTCQRCDRARELMRKAEKV